MNLSELYDNLYKTSIDSIKKSNFRVDEYLNDKPDDRFGITLLIRPKKELLLKIEKFLAELKVIEPHQYYYQNSDVHLTVTSIISCYSGFNLHQINVADYIEVLNQCLESINRFKIKFKGITASESSVMIQGFYESNTLDLLRNRIKYRFSQSDLEQSIDERYKLVTAHSTVVRFKKPVKQKTRFLDLLDKYREYDFGEFEVNELELVFNDWYQKKEKVELLKRFTLKA